MTDYTPTRGEIVSALVAYRASQGDRTPDEIVQHLSPHEVWELLGEVNRGIVELERLAAEEAWNEGFDYGLYYPRDPGGPPAQDLNPYREDDDA